VRPFRYGGRVEPGGFLLFRIRSSPGRRSGRAACLLGLAALAARGLAQPPAPPGEAGQALRHGAELLDREDPLEALASFRRVRQLAPDDPRGLCGVARAYLDLGRSGLSLRFASAATRLAPEDLDFAAVEVRALLRDRRFAAAAQRSRSALRLPAAERSVSLLAAHASALFRLQQNREAAAVYRRILTLDPYHPEAHVRLGSGLSEPVVVATSELLRVGVERLAAGDLDAAVVAFTRELDASPGNPVAHRLLGDALLARSMATAMPEHAAEFLALAHALPVPDLESRSLAKLVPAYAALPAARRAVVERAVLPFASYLPRLVVLGGTHDLLGELERTTDAPARAGLRGRRTFDGRVWDDVRGMGGLQAATGIEALDEAMRFGFDTLAHEVAHQVHLYAFPAHKRRRVRELYQDALAAGRCLDFYAASNEAEYFGQGVEAFVSYGKRPGREATHGHTRFELYRVDRLLHDFIAAEVDFDPLRDAGVRARLLPAAAAVALRCGRFEDAVVAVEMMDEGPEKARLAAAAWAALVTADNY
jgi:tetratricopeptide (TPR) repeat protein